MNDEIEKCCCLLLVGGKDENDEDDNDVDKATVPPPATPQKLLNYCRAGLHKRKYHSSKMMIMMMMIMILYGYIICTFTREQTTHLGKHYHHDPTSFSFCSSCILCTVQISIALLVVRSIKIESTCRILSYLFPMFAVCCLYERNGTRVKLRLQVGRENSENSKEQNETNTIIKRGNLPQKIPIHRRKWRAS